MREVEWVEGLLGRWPFGFQKFSIYKPNVCCAFINCRDKNLLRVCSLFDIMS